MITWAWHGAPTTRKGRSLEGVDNVAISNGGQVIIIKERTLETRGVQLRQDDLQQSGGENTHLF